MVNPRLGYSYAKSPLVEVVWMHSGAPRCYVWVVMGVFLPARCPGIVGSCSNDFMTLDSGNAYLFPPSPLHHLSPLPISVRFLHPSPLFPISGLLSPFVSGPPFRPPSLRLLCRNLGTCSGIEGQIQERKKSNYHMHTSRTMSAPAAG